MSITRTLLLTLCLLVVVTECRRKKRRNKICDKGWKHYCGDKTKCVKSMSEFDTDRECLKKGGIPGFIACLKVADNSTSEKHGRMCVQDLTNESVGFARNLMKAMQSLDAEDENTEDDEETEEDLDEFDDFE